MNNESAGKIFLFIIYYLYIKYIKSQYIIMELKYKIITIKINKKV